MPAQATHNFVATLSDGTVAVENQGDWQVVPGQRAPWPRLCEYVNNNSLAITSLRVNIEGQTFHAPKLDDRFAKGGIEPDYYSIEKIVELHEGGEEFYYIDIAAYFYNGEEGSTVSVHTIVKLADNKTSWTQLRIGYTPLAYAIAG